MKPLAIDLYCGLGGWTEGLLAEGYRVVGYDIEAHEYGEHRYPGELVLADVLTLHGSQFKDAALIVASPPCQEYSYMAMPWKRAKAKAAAIRADTSGKMRADFTALFDACFRIQREASEAAGHRIPLIVENVRGAQPWVGRARWSYGSFYLWGDVPALMPRAIKAQKFNPDGTAHPPGSWFAVADSKNRGARGQKNDGEPRSAIGGPGQKVTGQNPDGRKVRGLNWSDYGKPGYKAQGFNVTAAQRYREEAGVKQGGISGVRANGKGDKWFQDGAARHGSKSYSRKAASAMIAKIPLPLSRHIAATFKPIDQKVAA